MTERKHADGVGRSDIVRGLLELGVESGDGLVVHSALSSFGHVEGGADTVVDALLEAVGPSGTIVFPTFTGDAVISAILNESGALGAVILPEVADVDLDDLGEPKECHINTGAVPKAARRRPDFEKSLHPLYSICAKGPLARELVEMNDLYIFPSRENKFIDRLGRKGGKALLIGVTHLVNSAIHLVGEYGELEYKVQDQPYWSLTVDAFLAMPRDRQGELIRQHCGMTLGYDIAKQYDRIEPLLKDAGVIRFGRIGAADLRLMPIADFVHVGLAGIKSDPWLLADKL